MSNDKTKEIIELIEARLQLLIPSLPLFTYIPKSQTYPYARLKATAKKIGMYGKYDYSYDLQFNIFTQSQSPAQALDLRDSLLDAIEGHKLIFADNSTKHITVSSLDIMIEPSGYMTGIVIANC